MKIAKEEWSRYSKQLMLDEIGVTGQLKLKNCKVAVVGAGGLGCPILLYLSAVGVGHLGIIDFDTIAPSNLHRQILYSQEDVGHKKAFYAEKLLTKQNPYLSCDILDVVLDEENAQTILAPYDLVVDGCDNFTTRYAVNDACVALGKPLIYGSILGSQGQLALFNYQGSKNLRDLFPDPPPAEEVPNCSENGVLGTVPGIIGCYMAQLTTAVILDEPVPINHFFLFDLKNFQQKSLSY